MAASVLDFTLDGIPFLYNGQEVADPSATSWRKLSPIRWSDPGSPSEEKTIEETLEQYKKLFAMRASEPALTSGSVIWINNTEPKSVLSFMRKKGDTEILVILNLSNRDVNVTIDLPVMDYYKVKIYCRPAKPGFSYIPDAYPPNWEPSSMLSAKKSRWRRCRMRSNVQAFAV